LSAAPDAPGARVAACYESWAGTYRQAWYGPDAPHPPVHLDLVRDLVARHRPATLLDAGCGPASMLGQLLDLGIDPWGFDLTPAMVEEARRVLGGLGFGAERVWQGGVADHRAFRAPDGPARYDAVLCVGVLPHVPAAEEPSVLANLFQAVRPGGMVIVEARNALFDLFTFNRRTHEFVARVLIGSPADPAQAELARRALHDLKARLRMDQPPARPAAWAGFDEVARTHNPLLLPRAMQAAGFGGLEVLFYHQHALPPMYEALDPDAFRRASLAREDPQDWRGHFTASAFLVKGIRP
jgi:hypothetical protein